MTDLAGTELKTALLAQARELGLDALAVTHPSAIEKAGDRLRADRVLIQPALSDLWLRRWAILSPLRGS